MSYKIIQEIEKEEARCGSCQSGVDKLYCPLRECGMHTQYERQAGEENVLFEDTRETQFYSFPAASPDFSTDSSPEQMGDFLKRPTLIKTISWLPAGVSDADFDPWTLFLDNTEVKYKLNNFAYFRGNMHIKMVVNASPFHYGAMLINYTPTQDYVANIDNTNVTALIPQSQKPHLWIDLRENMGGEMILPFVWPYNYIKITSRTAIAKLGRLRNINYTGIASANGTIVNGVTIKFYAWMEDVELTANTVTLSMQGKKQVVDEYKSDGAVSRPATALAHWASYLTGVPIIGPYAKATQIGAGAVASVAGLFGWSKVPVIEDVKPIKPTFFHSLASAHLSEPISKVTLDPKAELSVDPKIVGPSTGEDELAISNIVQKDSFLFQTIWSSALAPDALIASCGVTPSLFDPGTPTGTVYQIGFTPMGYLAQMFRTWRGDIIFTVKVVASQYHRGRLRIHWEPNTVATSGDISNRTLTKIVDIGESTEIEIRIPYVNYSMWSNTSTTVSANFSTASPVSPIDAFFNGSMHIRVLNVLSAPLDTASVSVMIFVRGAENLEFSDPKEINDQMQPYSMQALVEDVDIDEQQISAPLDTRYLINYGEAVPSLRLLLQRSYLNTHMLLHNMSAINVNYLLSRIRITQTRFPTAPGYDLNSYLAAKGVTASSTDFKYSFSHHTPLTWLTPMYVARRGSIQWHYHLNDPDVSVRHLSCTRTADTISANSQDLVGDIAGVVTIVGASRSLVNYTANRDATSTACGTVITDNRVSPSLSVEMPQMTRARYQITRPDSVTIGYSDDGSSSDTYLIEMFAKPTYETFAKMILTRYCNAGTDFSLNMFLCAPHTYYSTNAGTNPSGTI